MQLTDIRNALSNPGSSHQLWAQAFSALLQLLRASGSDVGSPSSAHQALRSAVTNLSEPQRCAAWSSLVDAMGQPGYIFAFEQCLWELGHWELDPDRIVSMLEKCPYYLPAVLAATADSSMHSLQLKLAATGSPLLTQLLHLALPLVQGESIWRIQLRLWTSSGEWSRALLGMPAEVRTRTPPAHAKCCQCCWC